MKSHTRRLVVVAVVVGVLCSLGASAFAITFDSPSTSPFNVPGDTMGNPRYFDIVASGFAQNEPVFVQECDGASLNLNGYTVGKHCDIATGGTPVNADGNSVATFSADRSGQRLNVFKGLSPQGSFYCLSPDDPLPQIPPNPPVPVWPNCQIRVSGQTPGDTSEQSYLPIILPDDPNELTTTTSTTDATTTSSTTTSITSTTSTTSTTPTSTTLTTTTTIPAPAPLCGFGHGVPNPPSLPRNAGLLKVSPGLKATTSTAETKFKFTGSVDNCENAPTVNGIAITGGTLKLQVEMPPGSSCSGVAPGTPVKAKLAIKWSV
jgi:hypothetical protein